MIFGDVAADPVEEAVLTAITQTPGISRRELHKALGGHTKAAALNSILARLRDANRIRLEKIETATKPAERWFPCEQCEHSEQFGTGTSTPGTGDCSNNSHCSQHGQTSTGTSESDGEVEGYEPTHCRGCHKLLIDHEAKVVAEFSGDYCRECIEAGRVRDPFNQRIREWAGPTYPIGTILADEPEPELVCNHTDPEAWVVRDGKAFCAKCDKYMGRVKA